MKLSGNAFIFAAIAGPLFYGIDGSSIMVSIIVFIAGIIIKRSDKRKRHAERLREQEEDAHYFLAEQRYLRSTIDTILSQHAEALRADKRRNTRIDAYGVTDFRKWRTKSIPYFIEQVLRQQHRLPVPNPWFPELEEYIDQAIPLDPVSPPAQKKSRRA